MSEKYHPLRQSADADKFQIFEQWLRDNGAQFPLLELRQYDGAGDDADADADAGESDGDGDCDGDGDGDTTGLSVDDNPGPSRGRSCESSCEEKKESGPAAPSSTDDGSSEMRSVHAAAAIPPQTTVVSIPRRCLITVEMGQATPIGRKILASSLELDAPKHIFLMVFLLWDRKVRGPASFFHPYYEILPKSLRNMPVFWTEDELRHLQGSHLLVQIRDRLDAIRDDYQAICSVCPDFPAVASLRDFQWARMIVCSRNFGLLVDGHRTSALVPHADMLNHRRPRETKWTFDDETQCFTITTLQEIGKGRQVYDSYGQKCNHRFLLNYGFAVEDNRELDGFCPNEVPLELGLDLALSLSPTWEHDKERELDREGDNGNEHDHDHDREKERECWEKKLAFWTRGESSAQYHSGNYVGGGSSTGSGSGNDVGGDGDGGGLSSSFQALAAAVAGTAGRAGRISASIADAAAAVNEFSSPPPASDGDGTSASRVAAAAIATDSNHNHNHNQNRAIATHPIRPTLCPVKRIRVCVSNNENTRILFSMLRVLACTSSELDQIAWGSRIHNPSASSFYGSAANSAAHRLLGLAPPSAHPVVDSAPSSSSSPFSHDHPRHNPTARTCRDVRHPISLSNERRAMQLLLRITTRALSDYPTSLSRDVADLNNLRAYPRYSNKRHAKLQVKGEKEVLHHFALWARTAMHVIDIIEHELGKERRAVQLRFSEAGILCGGDGGRGDAGVGRGRGRGNDRAVGSGDSDNGNDDSGFRNSYNDSDKAAELGYDYVIQAMEDDDECHTTILRYCSDVLGAVRRDELNRIATDAAIRSKVGGNWSRP
ncbi:hypothetical protein ACHAXS_006759 [Conticribra weissflogii]